jgi:hypothetical protein
MTVPASTCCVYPKLLHKFVHSFCGKKAPLSTSEARDASALDEPLISHRFCAEKSDSASGLQRASIWFLKPCFGGMFAIDGGQDRRQFFY